MYMNTGRTISMSSMARWKALSESLDPAVIRFVVELRQLKDDSGLSLSQLALRTGYSASSWERYLDGRLLVPIEAAETLAGSVGADPVRLRVLHEAAADARRPVRAAPDRPPAEPAPPAPDTRTPPSEAGAHTPPGPLPRPGLRPAPRTVLTALVSAVAGAAIALLAVLPWLTGPARPSAAAATTSVVTVHYSCHYTRSNGLWYAGNSDTRTDLVEVDMSGAEVAELQCLLQRAGISPGGIDGNFGPLTERAVIREQQAQHLSVDGQVGPQTWGALRG